jgi:preprotein translocase subunit YajC
MDPLLIIMVLAVGAMFLLTSRTRKQQRQAGEFRQHLVVGDDVMTGSGLFGTIVDIDGDVITLESPSGGRTDWLRGAIAKLAEPPYAVPDTDEDVSDDAVDEDELTESDDGDLTELDEELDVDQGRIVTEAPSDDVTGPGVGDDTPGSTPRP